MGEKLIRQRLGFGKGEKVKKCSLIKKIICHGRRYRTDFLECFALDSASNKVAVIVPKKNIKLATGRNFLKRRMREAYRLNKRILTKTGHYLVFIYKTREKKSFHEIELCMINILLNLEIKN